MNLKNIKKIFIPIILIIILILLIVSCYKSKAAGSESPKVVKTFTQLAWLGYDTAKSNSLTDWYNIRACDNFGNIGHTWNQTNQVTCMHGSNTVTWSDIAQRPYVIIDINESGDDPLEAKLHVFIEDKDDDSDDSGTEHSSGSDKDDTEHLQDSGSLSTEKIVIIDENGKPVEITVQKDIAGHWETLDISGSYLNAMLAYVCFSAERLSYAGAENIKWALSYLWDDSSADVKINSASSGILNSSYRNYVISQARNYFGGSNPLVLLPNEPNNRYYDKDATVWNNGLKYIKQLKNNTNEKSYTCRLVMFNNGVSEARSVMYGKENTVERVHVNKHIDKVKIPTSYKAETPLGHETVKGEWEYSDWFKVKDRSKLDLKEKKKRAVNVVPNTYISYDIVVDSNVTGYKEVVDMFDSDNFDFVGYQSSDVSGTSSNGWKLYSSALGTGDRNTLKTKVYLEAYKPKTLKVVLKAKDELPSLNTKYDNQATCRGISDDDFVKCKYNLKWETTLTYASADMSKYIMSVESEGKVTEYSNRRTYSNSESLAKPVTVKKGDIVTYRLHVENTSTVDILTFSLNDIIEQGLDIYELPKGANIINVPENGKNTQRIEYSLKDINRETDQYIDIKLKVTKSNMYLLPVENEFILVDGNYAQRHTTDYIYTWTTDEYGENEELSSEKIIIDYTDESLINDENVIIDSTKNKDYIQLDDLTISGLAWIDEGNDGWYGKSPKVVEGVNVYLCDTDTDEVISSTTTNSKGIYTFNNVKKGNKAYSNSNYNDVTRKYADDSGYINYYVLFGYSGLDYETTKYIDESAVTDNGVNDYTTTSDGYTYCWYQKNHATEANVASNNREEFNNSFETVAYNKSYSGTTGSEEVKNLQYDKTEHESKIKWTDETTIHARSIPLFVKVEGGDTICSDDTEYLKHINLGLIERYSVDLSVTKDVVSTDVTVNGYKTTYNYDSLGKDKYKVADYNKISEPYKLGVYEEDYEFRTKYYYNDELINIKNHNNQYGSDNDLDVTITYKVTIKNTAISTSTQESNEYSVIREIIDYSSDEMTLQSVKTGSGEELTFSEKSNYNKENKYTYSGYKTAFITGEGLNSKIPEDGELEIYLIYKVNKDSNGYILKDNKSNDLGKINIAQISAFSIYDKTTNKPAGLIDMDSNPGNANKDYIAKLDDTTNYEDDVFQTSILVLLRKDTGQNSLVANRQIRGNVWEDLNNITLSSEQKVGDGIKEGNENGANNIKVKLMEVIRGKSSDTSEEQEYLVDTGIETFTNGSGDYVLENVSKLHAGQYVVRFIYGSEANKMITTNGGNTIKYSGQDYKSTVYKEVGNKDTNDEVLESNAFKDVSENKTYSVARDNEIRRLEVADYSVVMTYPLDNILKSTSSSGSFSKLAQNTAMYADTKKFNVQLEYPDNYTNFTKKVLNGLIINNHNITKIDFGLIERPLNKLQLMNDVKEIIATTSDGKELVHLYFDIIYTKDKDSNLVKHEAVLDETNSIGYQNAQCLNRGYYDSNNKRIYTSQGYRYINIDRELLQGMLINIKFQIAIANTSEIDSSNQVTVNIARDNNISELTTYLKSETPFNNNTVYKYGISNTNTLSELEKNMISNYSYFNLKNAINKMKDTHSQYRTIVDGASNNRDYEYGYFLGHTYYSGSYNNKEDVIVETRVDQIINYIDTELSFSPGENVSKNGDSKYLCYTIPEIAEKKLLMGIENGNEKITNGKSSYVTESRNNLAFSIEDGAVNKELYKFEIPLKPSSEYTKNNSIDVGSLYFTTIQASRFLSSEMDMKGLSLDNVSEILKVSNTIGRKVYLESGDTDYSINVTTSTPLAGYIGDSTRTITEVSTNVVSAAREVDTDFTEYTIFTPPTGLSQAEIKNRKVAIFIVTALITSAGAIATTIVLIKEISKKKFNK